MSLAGDKSKDRYPIIDGDTLSGISKRLFNDSSYWPKIWEINNENVKNPHFIYPGNALVFTPGTATSLPSVEVNDTAPSTPAPLGKVVGEDGAEIALSESSIRLTETIATSRSSTGDGPGAVFDERTPRPPGEWKKLPRQTWENTAVKVDATVDKNGFDSRNRQAVKRATGIELDYFLACEPLNPLGTVMGARKEAQFIDVSDEVTIESAQTLESGQTYSLVGKPITLESDGRKVESYISSGTIKVMGVNDGVYLGQVKNLNSLTERGDFVIPRIPRIQRVKPIPGPAPLEAKILMDSRLAPSMSAQYKWVYIDKGSADGVQPGMIFRFFQYKDPFATTDLTKSNMLVQGDVEVYQSCGGFSLGQVIWSKNVVSNDTPAILLTDVQDYYTRLYLNGNNTPLQIAPPSAEGDGSKRKEGDWLDDLDNGQDLTSEEDQELQQLEKVEESAVQTDGAVVPTLEGEDQLEVTPPPTDQQPTGDLPPPEEIPLDMTAPAADGGELPLAPSTDVPSDLPPETPDTGATGENVEI